MIVELQSYTESLRKQLTKALVRRKNLHTDLPDGKLFFYTTRRDVFRCYSSDKR